MDTKIQELTDRIFKDGVEKGNQEAARIIAEAEARKTALIEEAEAKAKEIVAALKNAGSDAEITVFDEADHFSVPRLAYLDANVGLMNWLIGN